MRQQGKISFFLGLPGTGVPGYYQAPLRGWNVNCSKFCRLSLVSRRVTLIRRKEKRHPCAVVFRLMNRLLSLLIITAAFAVGTLAQSRPAGGPAAPANPISDLPQITSHQKLAFHPFTIDKLYLNQE